MLRAQANRCFGGGIKLHAAPFLGFHVVSRGLGGHPVHY